MQSKTKELLTVMGFSTDISAYMCGKQGRTDTFFRRVSQQSANWRPQQALIDTECKWKNGRHFDWKVSAERDTYCGHSDLLPIQNMVRVRAAGTR